nr:MAG TPA: hypothetical protein [Caudoviricetes sp.]
MQEIQNLAQINYVLVILGLFAILFATKEILEIFGYFKKKFRIKTGNEEDRETVENRIKTLEKHDNWQYQEIQKISKGIDDIKKSLDINEKETNQRIIVQYGAELYNLHSKFMAQKYITRAGLETFQLLADTYIACGGNHSIKGKIIPEVMALPIKED